MGRSSWAFRQNRTGRGLVATWPIPPACSLHLGAGEGMRALEQIYCPGSLCVSCGPQVADPIIKLRLSWYIFHSQRENGLVAFLLLAVRESVMSRGKSIGLINC